MRTEAASNPTCDHFGFSCRQRILPDLSNSDCLPGRAGGTPVGLGQQIEGREDGAAVLRRRGRVDHLQRAEEKQAVSRPSRRRASVYELPRLIRSFLKALSVAYTADW